MLLSPSEHWLGGALPMICQPMASSLRLVPTAINNQDAVQIQACRTSD